MSPRFFLELFYPHSGGKDELWKVCGANVINPKIYILGLIMPYLENTLHPPALPPDSGLHHPVPREAQGIYRALAAGKTGLSTVGKPDCRAGSLTCNQPDRAFKVDIVVQSRVLLRQ